jgi:hypothetical protein
MSHDPALESETRSGLLELVDTLVAKGADRDLVIDMIEAAVRKLRKDIPSDGKTGQASVDPEEPANDWPAAER